MLLKNGFFLLLSLLLLKTCGGDSHKLTEIHGERIAIDSSIPANAAIEEFVKPYKEHLNRTLDSTLAWNPESMDKSQGELNTAIGNLMADIVMEQAAPVFKNRTGKDIDLVLLNQGGIRSGLDKGNITARSAYGLMPFENEIVVVEISGEKMEEMLEYLEQAKTAHPVSGIKLEMDKDYQIIQATINGEEIKRDKNYFVATSDYLQQGGDNMTFFKDPIALHRTDYKLRNAIIDYFEKTDTIKAVRDDRFIRKN